MPNESYLTPLRTKMFAAFQNQNYRSPYSHKYLKLWDFKYTSAEHKEVKFLSIFQLPSSWNKSSRIYTTHVTL